MSQLSFLNVAYESVEQACNRHAPPGYTICMQLFQNSLRPAHTEREALVLAMESLGHQDVVIMAGHYDCGERGELTPTYRPHGWMVFWPQRKVK